jgi:hypothetical protein
MAQKIIVLLLVLQSFAAFAQVPVNNFTQKEKLYLQLYNKQLII